VVITTLADRDFRYPTRGSTIRATVYKQHPATVIFLSRRVPRRGNKSSHYNFQFHLLAINSTRTLVDTLGLARPTRLTRRGMHPGRQLDLKRHALEVLIEMFDPVFRLLTIQRWHQCCDRIRAASRAPHPVCGAIKNNVANLERVRHLSDRHSNASAINLKSVTMYVATAREAMIPSRTGAFIFYPSFGRTPSWPANRCWGARGYTDATANKEGVGSKSTIVGAARVPYVGGA